MKNHKGKLESFRAPMEKRERVSTEQLFVSLKGWARKRTVMGVGRRYKYLPHSQWSDKSW
jgi:hypothetical protein